MKKYFKLPNGNVIKPELINGFSWDIDLDEVVIYLYTGDIFDKKFEAERFQIDEDDDPEECATCAIQEILDQLKDFDFS